MSATRLAVSGRALVLALLAAAGSVAPDALAQQAGQRSNEPGQIERRIDPPQPVRPPEDVPDVAPMRPAAPTVLEQPALTFVLTAVEFAGATQFEPATLAALYESQLGRPISLADVERIVAAVTALYHDAGFILTSATAPPQTLELGILRIDVIEGYVERVVFSGPPPDRRSLLDAYAAKITAERPLSLPTLERYLLLMGDLPGMTAKPSLTLIDPETGAHELAIALTQRGIQPYASIDNRGTHSVGPIQAAVGANLNSALGLQERSRLTFFTTPELPREILYGEIHQEHVIGAEGTIVSAAFSRNKIDAHADLTRAKKDGRSSRLSLAAAHPAIRTRDQTLWLATQFDLTSANQTQPGDTFEDRLRVVRAAARYGFADGLEGRNHVNLEVSQGLDILNATETGSANLSRLDGRSDFTKAVLDIGRYQRLGPQFGAMVQAAGQRASATVLSAEEFLLGGRRFGRAYDPSEITGRHGLAASIELQHHNATGLDFPTSYQVYAFYDVGAVWNQGSGRDTLASAGLGLRLELVTGLIGQIELASPLTRHVAAQGDSGDDARVFFSLTANF